MAEPQECEDHDDRAFSMVVDAADAIARQRAHGVDDPLARRRIESLSYDVAVNQVFIRDRDDGPAFDGFAHRMALKRDDLARRHPDRVEPAPGEAADAVARVLEGALEKDGHEEDGHERTRHAQA